MSDNHDDLDDILDVALKDFDEIEKKQTQSSAVGASTTSTNASSATPPPQISPTAPFPVPPASSADLPQNPDEAVQEFARSLASIVEDLSNNKEFTQVLDELAKKMETLNRPSEAASAAAPSAAQGANSASSSTATELSEESQAILTALQKLADSAKSMEAGKDSDELLDQILDEFEGSTNSAALMESMMKQLMAKSILYEPLKELRDKYVPWLEQNQPKLETSEYLRYTKQYRLLQEIIQVYDTEGDDGFQKIVDLMQQMQEQGQPPADIVKSMAPGIEFGPDGFPVFPGLGDGKQPCTIL